MPTQVILLEHVDNLGNLGDVVSVKPGFARNYLIPQNKALRATKANIAYFEAQKAHLEKANADRRGDAAKEAAKLKDLKVSIIRHAAEGGQLYGSVNARDIAEIVTAKSGVRIARGQITLHDAYKAIGLFKVTVALHPEVKETITLNIARSEEEAAVQEKIGRALIAGASEAAAAQEPAAAETAADETAAEAGDAGEAEEAA